VWDFDDDNCMSDATRALLNRVASSGVGGITSMTGLGLTQGSPQIWLASELSVTNPYLLFGSPEYISPRGMPLEFLSKREFPRIVQPAPELTDVQVDVIQVIQNLDPDVDAIWRLHNAERIPMHWMPSPALGGLLVGIHPQNMAPFNAQATILSRRALSVSFLPSTVHGRVSDIWRSYIMQHLLARGETVGVLAFSSASVLHRRNPHKAMADFHGELQLYHQSLALVTYLQSRPPCNCPIDQAFVLLMDDLYMRGFVELDDVKAAVVWAEMMLKDPGPWGRGHIGKQAGVNAIISLPPSPPAVVAVLHINHCHREVIPLWMALHKHMFLAVQVYTPGCGICSPISGISVNCLSDDSAGYFAYESFIHTIERAAAWPGAQSFLFTHDDVVWRQDLPMSGESRYLGLCPLLNDACYKPLEIENNDWYWLHRPVGLEAVQRFKALLPSAEQPHMYQGHADFYMVGVKDLSTFLHYGRMMRQSNLFLEIAVPTVFASFIRVATEPFTLYTTWTDDRQRPASVVAGFHSSRTQVVHPVKLVSLDGILGHLQG